MDIKDLFISYFLFIASTAAVFLSASSSFSVFPIAYSSLLFILILHQVSAVFGFSLAFCFVLICSVLICSVLVCFCCIVLSCRTLQCGALSCPYIILLAFFSSIQCSLRADHSDDAVEGPIILITQ